MNTLSTTIDTRLRAEDPKSVTCVKKLTLHRILSKLPGRAKESAHLDPFDRHGMWQRINRLEFRSLKGCRRTGTARRAHINDTGNCAPEEATAGAAGVLSCLPNTGRIDDAALPQSPPLYMKYGGRIRAWCLTCPLKKSY